MNNVDSYATEECLKFITGARSLDEFDDYVNEMINKGCENVTEAYTQWYITQ